MSERVIVSLRVDEVRQCAKTEPHGPHGYNHGADARESGATRTPDWWLYCPGLGHLGETSELRIQPDDELRRRWAIEQAVRLVSRSSGPHSIPTVADQFITYVTTGEHPQ